jgi:hypothetical protein
MRAMVLAAALAAAACSPPAEAPVRRVTAGELSIENASFRPPPGGVTTGAGYMTIRNGGVEPDRLVGASSPQATTIELHTHREVAGAMRMERVEGVDVPARGSTTFAPGGLHLMMFGFVPAGEETPVTLRFEKAGEVTVAFVRASPAGEKRGH